MIKIQLIKLRKLVENGRVTNPDFRDGLKNVKLSKSPILNLIKTSILYFNYLLLFYRTYVIYIAVDTHQFPWHNINHSAHGRDYIFFRQVIF
jgi:hypothetical protein